MNKKHHKFKNKKILKNIKQKNLNHIRMNQPVLQ